MKRIKFDPKGPAMRVEINYLGAITASYVYILWGATSNARVDERSGNNQNDQDDRYELPMPVDSNLLRKVEVFSILKNGDSVNLKAVVVIKIFQGNKKIGEVKEEELIDAKKTVINDIFIQLIK